MAVKTRMRDHDQAEAERQTQTPASRPPRRAPEPLARITTSGIGSGISQHTHHAPRHHQRKRNRQQPRSRARQVRAPDPDRHHRNQMGTFPVKGWRQSAGPAAADARLRVGGKEGLRQAGNGERDASGSTREKLMEASCHVAARTAKDDPGPEHRDEPRSRRRQCDRPAEATRLSSDVGPDQGQHQQYERQLPDLAPMLEKSRARGSSNAFETSSQRALAKPGPCHTRPRR